MRPVLALVLALIVAACERPAPEPWRPRPGELAPDVAPAFAAVLAPLEHDPRDAAAWRVLGETCEANGLMPQAEEAYRTALELDPNDARSRYHLARMLVSRGEVEAALVEFARTAEFEPRYAPAHWRRGLGLLELGRLTEARAAFGAAHAVDAESWIPRAGLARVALQEGRASEAVTQLESALSEHPRVEYLHHLLGLALRELGELDRARFELRFSGEPMWIDPWHAEVRERRAGVGAALELGQWLVAEGRADEAVALLEQHVTTGDVAVLGALTSALVAANRHEEAERQLRAALDGGLDHYRLHVNLGLVARAAGDLESANRHARAGLERHPTFAPGWQLLGHVLLEQGELAGAEDALSRAALYGTQGGEAWMRLAAVRARLGRFDVTAEAYERAGVALPGELEPWLRRAEALARAGLEGQARAAVAELERALPNDARVQRLTRELDAWLEGASR